MRHAAALPEPLPPDLESEETDDEDAERDDFGEVLPAFDEDSSIAEDADESPLDEAGREIDALSETEPLDDDTPNDLDLGPDSVDDEDTSESGDAVGIESPGGSDDEEPEDTLPSDDEERDGIDDARPVVSELDLPGLDADAEGTDDDLVRFGALVFGTESALESASVPWRLVRLSPERERCGALCLSGDTVVAGSTDLLWLDAGRAAPMRVALEGTRITSLCLVGRERETVLCVTAQGRLMRRGRVASDVECLAEVGRVPALGEGLAGAELCQRERDTPASVLGRTSSGLLFQSDDAGATLRPLEPRLTVSALSATGSPVTALTRDGKELLREGDGRSFDHIELSGVALAVATGEAARVASAGRTVAIFDGERGVVVSTDAGRTFRPIQGSASVSAAAAGVQAGTPQVWLALYSETNDTTRFVQVAAEDGSAQVIATLVGTGDTESDHGENARIDRLAWDGSRLFATGEAGLFVLSPETASP